MIVLPTATLNELRIDCSSGWFLNSRGTSFVLKLSHTRKRAAAVERVGDDEHDRQEQEDVDDHGPHAEAEGEEVEAAPPVAGAPGSRRP